MKTRLTLNGASILLATSLLLVGMRSAVSKSTLLNYVQLQPSTPGTIEVGNFNIDGLGIAGRLRGIGSMSPGVQGTSTATDGWGVRGDANTGANAKGLYGNSTTGYGGYAIGYSFGMYSKATGPTGIGYSGIGANGVYGSGSLNYGVKGLGLGASSYGVWGVHYPTTGTTAGVFGETNSTATGASGIFGRVGAGGGTDSAGVRGSNLSAVVDSYGIAGIANGGHGVYGSSTTGWGVYGTGNYGVYGSGSSYGVYGSGSNYGVYGTSSNYGVYGTGSTYGGYFMSNSGTALYAGSTNVNSALDVIFGKTLSQQPNVSAILGRVDSTTVGSDAAGVKGHVTWSGFNGLGVYGQHDGAGWGTYGGTVGGVGVYGYASSNNGANYGGYFQSASPSGYASYFVGSTHIQGALSKSSGTFLIDHPQDPANKFLSHSFVESPDMMNIYNGNVKTDARGIAWVDMPSYFESLNMDFRYQLTVLDTSEDGFAMAKVYRPISGNRFAIKTNQPNVQVSWQVTGVRKDAWANAHRVIPETEKNSDEKGYYLAPELYGAGEDLRLNGNAWRRAYYEKHKSEPVETTPMHQ